MSVAEAEINKLFTGLQSPSETLQFVEKRNPEDYFNRVDIHLKSHGSDGVSLELQKLATSLSATDILFHGRQTIKTHILSGDFPPGEDNGRCIPFLRYDNKHPEDEVYQLFQRMFGRKNFTSEADKEIEEQKILDDISKISDHLEKDFEEYIDLHHIGTVHIRNILSLPFNIPAAIALVRLMVRRHDLIFILQHHDFCWEASRENKFTSEFDSVNNIVRTMFPPDFHLPNMHTIVISSKGKKGFARFRENDADVITDTFPYDRQIPEKKYSYKQLVEIRHKLGFSEDDIVFGIMTRVIKRKDIEQAIQLAAGIKRLLRSQKVRNEIKRNNGTVHIHNGILTENSKVKVVFFQDEDTEHDYLIRLREYADKCGIDLIEDVAEKIAADNNENRDGGKLLSFYDSYAVPNITPYTPESEGFGNQLQEIVWAGFIPVLFEYPVFQSDIKQNLPHFVSYTEDSIDCHTESGLRVIGKNLNKIVWKVYKSLTDPQYVRKASENFSSFRNEYDVRQSVNIYIALLKKAVEDQIKNGVAVDFSS